MAMNMKEKLCYAVAELAVNEPERVCQECHGTGIKAGVHVYEWYVGAYSKKSHIYCPKCNGRGK